MAGGGGGGGGKVAVKVSESIDHVIPGQCWW